MKSKSFEELTHITRLEGFKESLKKLNEKYKKIQGQFNELCDELDNHVINEHYLKEVSDKLTFYIIEMKTIEQKIKDISESLERIKAELSN